ncbi:PHP domain-containing protein [Dactylosporangium sp. NPDC051485]|uniref:PHP domain-containing protein n=1 Tax=Dactylosporangium sp. NPDC051485 TaxID=3154846 RepID=UPI003429F636
MSQPEPAAADATGPPADAHVHSECSWDAPYASMEQACRRAAELGLPSIALTDHADFTPRRIADAAKPQEWKRPMIADRVLTPPPLDVARYLRSIEACRERFPGLRIVSGIELGEPHRHRQRAAEVLDGTGFERILASVHTLPGATGATTVDAAFEAEPPHQVVRRYLAEVHRLTLAFTGFHVLAHINYAARFWPQAAGEHLVTDFEEDYRAVFAVLAATGKVLEVNTNVRFDQHLLRWWRLEGGQAIAFGSDAHRPEQIARGFAEASTLAATAGFLPSGGPGDLWMRR